MLTNSRQQRQFSYLDQRVTNITNTHRLNQNNISIPIMQLNQNNNNQSISTSNLISPQQQTKPYIQSCTKHNIQSCTKHNNKGGQFYQTQYPWIRYCQSCALNLALCGKKIQKCLTSQQMFNKIKLSDTLKSINHMIKLYQQKHQQRSIISQQLQQQRQYYASIIGQIDKYVHQVMQIRNLLEDNLKLNINKEIKQMYDKQSCLISKKMQLIKQKTYIECGFVQLIGKQNQQQSLQIISKCQLLLSQSDTIINNQQNQQQYQLKLSHTIQNINELFNQQLQSITNMKINFKPLEPSSYYQTNHITSKYQHPNTQKQIPISLSDKIQQTQYSTLQHSSIITPSCQLTHISQHPLTQQSQNKKNTKSQLQLQSRCKSKSKQNKKLNINVRQNIQNTNKKKYT